MGWEDNQYVNICKETFEAYFKLLSPYFPDLQNRSNTVEVQTGYPPSTILYTVLPLHQLARPR
jgi:hypothetical protein